MFSLKSLPLAPQHYLAPTFILALAIIAYFFDSQLSDSLIYDLSALNNGQYWRILTGHFFHSNLHHLLLNAAALLLLWSLHGHFYRTSHYLFVFAFIATFCSAGMYFFSPDIELYVGLSGVLHGFFVWGALMDIKNAEKTGYLLFIGVLAKVAYEQLYGASAELETFINVDVAIDAHLYGAIGGLLVFIGILLYRKLAK